MRVFPMYARESSTILVADEDLLMRWAIRQTLSAAGFVVFEASRAEEALTSLQAREPELVIVEVELFRPSSHALTRALEDYSRNRCVILMTSGFISRDQLGVDHIDTSHMFEKPVSLEHLAAVVTEALTDDAAARRHD